LADQGATVVVCTLDRGAVAANCIRDLLAQTHRPLEILIVDQSWNSSSELSALAKMYPAIITWRRVDFRGLPSARNYAWQQARFEAIVYVDDDIHCGPELVSEHLRTLERPGVGIVAGGIDEDGQRPVDIRFTGFFDYWRAFPRRDFNAIGEKDVDHAPGGNFSVWRSVLATQGGIDEGLQQGAALYEETDFCLRALRAGHRIRFNGKARLFHLRVSGGGCRIPDIKRYIFGLAHNRSVLIVRHLRWYQQLTALFELARLVFSHAIAYREPAVFSSALKGALAGRSTGRKKPHCTNWST